LAASLRPGSFFRAWEKAAFAALVASGICLYLYFINLGGFTQPGFGSFYLVWIDGVRRDFGFWGA
jgi:hypothetical protein